MMLRYIGGTNPELRDDLIYDTFYEWICELDGLAQCKESDELILQEILDSIKKVLYNEKYLLCNEEDERMARVICRMIKRNSMSCQLINNWIEGLSQCSDWERTRMQYIAHF